MYLFHNRIVKMKKIENFINRICDMPVYYDAVKKSPFGPNIN